MSKKSNAVMDLTKGPVGKTLMAFSVPFVISTLLQTLYSTVDTVVVGQVIGSSGLSAVSNASMIMQLVYMVLIGFANAGQVMIAQYKGAGDHGKIQNTIGSVFYFVVGVSVVLGGLAMIFVDPILKLMDTPSEAYQGARDYMLICSGCLIFTGLYNLFSAILRGLGDSKHPMIFVIIASVMNVILDILFVAVFQWGEAGAAWATIIGQAASVVFCFWFLARHSEELGFKFSMKDLRFVPATMRQMLVLGFPMAIRSAAINISFLFVSRMINGEGVIVSAAFGVTQKLRNVPGVITQAIGLGVTSMVGQNLGAGKQQRVSDTIRSGIIFSTVTNVLFGVIFFLLPELSFRLFTQEEAVLAFASMCIFTILIEIPAKSVMPPCGALVNAQGFMSFGLIVAFLDAFAGRVFMTWLFGKVLGLGAYGYFLGFSLATYVSALPEFIYYVSGLWKKRKLLK